MNLTIYEYYSRLTEYLKKNYLFIIFGSRSMFCYFTHFIFCELSAVDGVSSRIQSEISIYRID